MKKNYRPEIDSLRAIAVLLVIFYHAEINFFKGGFIGVDIFIVISGYVITKLFFFNDYSLNNFIKNELFISNSILFENSAIDSIKFSKINNDLEFFFKKNRIILYYSYYFYSLKLKLNVIMLYNFYKKNRVASVDKLYKNAS